MPQIHVVEQGDTFFTIAAKYGIADWHTLLDAPSNATLKQQRKNPHVLYPGDKVTIPDANPNDGITVQLDGRIQLRRRRRDRQPLQIELSNVDWRPMANVEYTLSFESGKLQGRTDGQGRLSVELPLDAKSLRLEVSGLEFELHMGHLNPLEHTDDNGISGAQGRLKNLGYFEGAIDGRDSPELQRAIRQFQLQHQVPREGQLDDATRAKLLEKHGS